MAKSRSVELNEVTNRIYAQDYETWVVIDGDHKGGLCATIHAGATKPSTGLDGKYQDVLPFMTEVHKVVGQEAGNRVLVKVVQRFTGETETIYHSTAKKQAQAIKKFFS